MAAEAAAAEEADEPGPQGEAELRAALAREVAARSAAQVRLWPSLRLKLRRTLRLS